MYFPLNVKRDPEQSAGEAGRGNTFAPPRDAPRWIPGQRPMKSFPRASNAFQASSLQVLHLVVWFRLPVHWLKRFWTLPGFLLVSLLLITSCLFPRISKFAHNPQDRSTPGVYIFFSRCKKKSSSSSGLVSSPCLAPTPDLVILISLNNLSWASCQKIFCNFPLNFYMAHFWNT